MNNKTLTTNPNRNIPNYLFPFHRLVNVDFLQVIRNGEKDWIYMLAMLILPVVVTFVGIRTETGMLTLNMLSQGNILGLGILAVVLSRLVMFITIGIQMRMEHAYAMEESPFANDTLEDIVYTVLTVITWLAAGIYVSGVILILNQVFSNP